MVSFDVSKRDRHLISDIVDRAMVLAEKAGAPRHRMTLEMDITAVHANGRPLRLVELASADDFNLAHDVFGIEKHLDRQTGTLGGCFVPRFSV